MKKVLIIGAAAILAVATTGTAVHLSSPAQSATSIPSVESFLDARSPGDRIGYGELSPSKQQKLSKAIVSNTKIVYREPSQEVYRVVPSATVDSDLNVEYTPIAPVSTMTAGSSLAAASSAANILPSQGSFIAGSVGQVFMPQNPVTPSVPEPATWLSMILGFSVIGYNLRTKKQLSLV